MKPHKRLLLTALLFIGVLTAIMLWMVQVSVPRTTAEHVRHGGSLRVGFALEAPYAFYDAHGNVTGEAVEIFRLLARRQGIEHIDWVRLDFANLIPELQLGRIDAIAAGMFITPQREVLVAFTRPTAAVRAALIVPTGEQRLGLRPRLTDLPGLADRRIATIHGAVENDVLRAAGVPDAAITTVPDADRGLRALLDATAGAFAISSVTAWHLVSNLREPALEVRTVVDAPVGLPAFAFRLADEPMRQAMDRELRRFLGSDEHRLLVQRFGFTSDELPPPLP